MLTTALELACVLLAVAFAAVVWPPAALAVASIACGLAAWVREASR